MFCPVCGNIKNKTKYTIHSFRILECLNCHHRFTDKEANQEETLKIYSAQYFFGGKDGYSNYLLKGFKSCISKNLIIPYHGGGLICPL